ncbi:MAG: hypothetical protein GY849_02625 [Deltaproteobacteria bacterium]|nr:hypothetical protein [Deltaproteobacteria bacterium]
MKLTKIKIVIGVRTQERTLSSTSEADLELQKKQIINKIRFLKAIKKEFPKISIKEINPKERILPTFTDNGNFRMFVPTNFGTDMIEIKKGKRKLYKNISYSKLYPEKKDFKKLRLK